MAQAEIAYDGQLFEDQSAFEAHINPNIPPELKRVYITGGEETKDEGVISPEKAQRQIEQGRDPKIIYDDQGNTVDYDLSTPGLAPQMPTDALKPTEGSQTPENIQNAPVASPGLSMVGAVTDWAKRQAEYPGKIMNVLRGMANPSTDEDTQMLKHFYDTAKKAFQLPGDVAKGEVDPSSTLAIQRAADLAMIAVGAPAPIAAKAADGTLGSFAGVRSATFKGEKLNELARAQVLESQGIHKDVILKDTGMFRGTDGRWRYEIDDSKAALKPEWHSEDSLMEKFKEAGYAVDKTYGRGNQPSTYSIRKWKTETKVDPQDLNKELTQAWSALNSGMVSHKLTEIFDHPELYRAYPQLKDIKVVYDPKHKSAHADPVKKEIVIGPHYKDNVGVMMHEVQHLIQSIEGFAGGGAPLDATKAYRLRYQKAFEELKPEMEKLIAQSQDPKAIWTKKEVDRLRELGHIAERYKVYVEEADKQATQYYMRLSGEVEARNVDTRVLMSANHRRQLPPYMTQDLDAIKEILMSTHTNTTAYGVFDPKTKHLVKPPK